MSCRTDLPQKPPVAQLLIQFLVFYTTHKFVTIFTTASLTSSHLISLVHSHSVLTYILHWTTSLLRSTCLVHFKCNADTPKWGVKKKMVALIILIIALQFDVSTSCNDSLRWRHPGIFPSQLRSHLFLVAMAT